MTNPPGLHTRLAQLEHKQWAHWTDHMLGNCTNKAIIKRWQRLIKTPFSELSKQEQASDYEWAGRVLTILEEAGINLHESPILSEKATIPTGWQCPLCGMVWAPWVMNCECQKDDSPLPKYVEALQELRDQNGG